ncbi:MAG: hypothetical protein JXP34_04590 [Planctomycetes bacterium]|nr:hypothetical protein [Planctomycetota bacterium]
MERSPAVGMAGAAGFLALALAGCVQVRSDEAVPRAAVVEGLADDPVNDRAEAVADEGADALADGLTRLETKIDALTAKIEEDEQRANARRPSAFDLFAPFFSFDVRGADPDEVVRAMALQPGTRWVYDETDRQCMDSVGRIAEISCRREVTIAGHRETPHGLLVIRDEVMRDVKRVFPEGAGEEQVSWFTEHYPRRRFHHLLIREGHVYRVWAVDSNGKTFDPVAGDPASALGSCPEFFFPMTPGIRWSNREQEERDFVAGLRFHLGTGPAPNPGQWYWIAGERVDERAERGSLFAPVRGAIPIVWRDNTGATQRWFWNGVGIVKEVYKHGGSFRETKLVLADFRRGR